MTRRLIDWLNPAACVLAVLLLSNYTASAQDPPDGAGDGDAGLAQWVPALRTPAVQWRDDLGTRPVGPPRVVWTIAFDTFAVESWSLPGTSATQEALARTAAGVLRANPVITQRGRESETWRVRDTLRGLIAQFTRPGGSLLIWLQARAWRAADGQLMLVHSQTRPLPAGPAGPADGERYTNGLPLRALGEWLQELRQKLGDKAPAIGLVLELYKDPLGAGMARGELTADDNHAALAGITRVEVAGARDVCADNLAGTPSAAAAAFSAAVADVQAGHGVTLRTSMTSPASRVVAPTPTAPTPVVLRPARLAVRVTVRNALDGRVIDGANVAAAARDAVAAPADFDELDPPTLTLRAGADGFVPLRVDVPLDASRDRLQLDLRLMPAFALLDITLHQPDGAPAAGVNVSLQPVGADTVLIATSGLHRRGARTDAAGRARLPISVAALRAACWLALDDGVRELQRTKLPALADDDAATVGTLTVRGGAVAVRTVASITLAQRAQPLDVESLEFAPLGRFMWNQGADADATMPVSEAPVALAAWRSALGLVRADDAATRDACRFRLRQSGVAWLSWCRVVATRADSPAPPALLLAAARESAALLEVFPDDTQLRKDLEFFEYAALPPTLQRTLTDAVALVQAGKLAEALPMLQQLADDPRVPPATAAACRRRLASVRDTLLKDRLAAAQRHLSAGRFHEALDEADAAAQLAPELPLVSALQTRVLDALAGLNTTRERALPLRAPARPANANAGAGAADASRLDVSLQAWLESPQRWFTLDLPRDAAVSVTLMRRLQDASANEETAPAIRLLGTPAGSNDVGIRLAMTRTREAQRLVLPAGRTTLCVERDADAANPAAAVGFYLRIEADWSAAVAAGGASAEPDVAANGLPIRAHTPLVGHTSADTAIAAHPGEYRHQLIAPLSAHWYRLTFARPTRLDCVLTLEDVSSGPTVTICDEALQVLAESDVIRNGCRVGCVVPAGDVLVCVTSGDSGGARYSLSIADVPEAGSSGIGFTPDTAKPAAPGRPELFAVEFARPRWFALRVDQPGLLTVLASFRHADGDVDIALYDAATMRELARATGSADGEQLAFDSIGGDYLVKVWNSSPAAGAPGAANVVGNRVVLLATLTGVTAGAGPGPTDAKPLQVGDGVHITIPPSDPAWFRVAVESVSQLRVSAQCDPMQGEVTLQLFAGSIDTVVASGDVGPGTNGRAATRLGHILQPGVYLLRVQMNGVASKPVDVEFGTALRSLSGNVSAALAVPIEPGLYDGLPVVSSARWYALDVTIDEARVLIIANPSRGTPADAGVELALYDADPANPAEPASGPLAGSSGRYVQADVTAGRYWLCVRAAGGGPPSSVVLDVIVGRRMPGLRGSAQPLDGAAATTAAGCQLDGNVEPGSSRWFVLPVALRSQLAALCTFVHDNGDLDLRLWRNRERIVWSETGENTEALQATIEAGQVVLLQVAHVGAAIHVGHPAQPFHLKVNTTPAPQAAVAPGHTSADTASVLNPRVLVNDTVRDGRALWYRLLVAANQRVRVDMAFEAGAGLTLSLRQGERVLAVGETRDDHATVDLQIAAGGEYFVVVSPAGSDNAAFRLFCLCGFDGANDIESARPCGAGTLAGQTISAGTSRVFAFAVLRHSQCTVAARFRNADGDLDLRLTRIDGGEIASSADTRDIESVRLMLRPGVYAVAVTHAGDRGDTTFALSLTLEAQPDAGPASAWPNIDADTAQIVEPDQTVKGRSGDGFDAWYRVTFAKNVRATIVVTFRHSDGDLDVDLRQGTNTGQAVAESNGEDDREEIVRQCDAGDWYVRVFNYDGGRSNAFELKIVAQELTEGLSPMMPLPLTPGAEGTVEVSGEFSGGLSRWYSLDLDSDAQVVAALETAAGADARLMWHRDGAPVTAANGSNGSVQLTMDSLAAGRWLLEVVRQTDDRAAFRLNVRCRRYSDAVSRDTAIVVSSGMVTQQTLAAGAQRWLRVDLPAPARLFALVTGAGETPLSLQLHGGSGIVSSATVAGSTSMISEVLPAGQWFLRVEAPASVGNDGAQFSLLLEVGRADSKGRAGAERIKPGAMLAGVTDGGDTRWFCLVLTRATRVTLTVSFTNAQGDIDLRLWRGAELVTVSDGTGDSEVISLRLEPGVHFLELMNVDDGMRSPWRLSVEVEGSPDKEFR